MVAAGEAAQGTRHMRTYRMRNFRTIVTMVMIPATCAVLAGCGAQWQASKLTRLDGFGTPESVCVAPWTGEVFVSNIMIAPTGDDSRWDAADGTGFISRLGPGARGGKIKWVQSTTAAPLNSTKGVCAFNDVLYVADVVCVRRISIPTGKTLKPIVITGAKSLNDVACDGKYVYVSDTVTGKIHRIDGDKHTVISEVTSANGLACSDGKMFCASWVLHEIFEVDPTGKTEPIPFGLAGKLVGLDGIVAMPDGKLLISDLRGGKILLVGTDRKTVRTLIEIDRPADIAVDHARGLLYIPTLDRDAVFVYRLWKE